jgi:signal transduction histidine kinase
VSYRSFKHLLGETSLERKCRFIFGAGILLLVTISFTWYGRETELLVRGQNTQTARDRVNHALEDLHKQHLVHPGLRSLISMFSQEQSALEEPPRHFIEVLNPYKPGSSKPIDKSLTTTTAAEDPWVKDRMAEFLRWASDEGAYGKAGAPRAKDNTFANGRPIFAERFVPGKREYQYAQAVLFRPNCLMPCHSSSSESDDPYPIDDHIWRPNPNSPGKFVKVKAGDLAGVMVVNLQTDEINKAVNRNRAYLITAALVTAILAMFASYVIVRYVIVKPVKHLRDVSDAIAAGKFTIRSKIETGDEFEELSHAFNRMLHNLLTMQQELRNVNGDLDKKVDELAQANLALFEMNRLKSDFLATMSHELRTPLNSIIGFSEVLSVSSELNDRQKRYASNIQTSGKMLLGMINDILDLAKIESGKMEVRTEDFSLRDVCEALTSLARPIAERKSINLECKLDEAIPLLRQDAGKLRQILYNLLSNAIKFTPDGGRVTLSARAEGRFAVVRVEDTGIGIAEEDREKIFEKFRQAGVPGAEDGVLTREHQGTGLGLSIVRELTKLLGGDVHLNSRPGQGSTFTIRIPLQLPGNRKFEVNLTDDRIDLTKARRVETRAALPLLDLHAGESFTPHSPRPIGGSARDR